MIIFYRKGSEAKTVAYLIVAAIWMYVIGFAVIGALVFNDGNERYITPVP
jgi:hypothetical protein